METAVLEIPKKRGTYGDGSISVRPNGRFQIQFYDRTGRKRRETYRTQDKAERMLRKRIAQRDAGVLETATDTRVKVDTLAESYKLYAKNSRPKSAYWIGLVWSAHLEPFFGGFSAARLSSDDIERYIAQRLKASAKTSTVNREVAVLKAMFYHGAESDPPKVMRVPKFPEKLREPDARAGFITDEDYGELQAACKHEWLRALLAVAYNFGFRKGELLGLRVSQVDLKAREIRLLPGTTKNDKGRTVVMTEEVHTLLAGCVKGKKPGDAVFTWPNGAPVEDFRGSWKALTKAAGLAGLLVHDLRRSAVRNLLRAGVSKHTAKRISGHKTDSIFDRYDIVDPSDLEDAARKLENSRKLAAGSTEQK